MPDHENLPVHIENWFAMAHGSGGAMIPLPFVKDILLLESSVVGTKYVKDIERKLENIGRESILEFRRDPRNPHDAMAIQVLNERGERIGFVPSDDNMILARLMDAGKSLYGKVREVRDPSNWRRIAMDIYLRDL